MINFDFKEFMQTDFIERTGEVSLLNFGDTGDSCKFQVRGLTAADIAEIENSVQKNRMASRLYDAAVKMTAVNCTAKDQADAIRELTGFAEGAPDNLIRKYVIFERGVIDPKPEIRADVVKFGRVYPIEFDKIINKILELTGKGHDAKKKPKFYGKTETSEPI